MISYLKGNIELDEHILEDEKKDQKVEEVII
jgi:hypothetical protein